jgi:serine/threonine protein kinase/tetratricopeptide (TPR) repeat protein
VTEPARWRRIEEICGEALDRTGEDQTAYVAAACGDDVALRQEVDALLARVSSADILPDGQITFVAAQVLSEVARGSLVGRQLGAYTVLAPLGAGGMGEVYRAHDTRLARDVAIKILPKDPTPNRSRSRRFRQEAQAIASLNHPHICVVHDVGEQDGISYLVMEYLDGQTLKERLEDETPLSLPEALTIALDLADALVEAHRHGIVHRDVKPGNIMLTSRGTKLLDFGLARPVGPFDSTSTTALTSPGVVLGTPHYMSPEQARGQPVDARSDVFSLGAVIYEMVTGCRPFDGVNVVATIEAVLHRDPRAVSDLRPETPPALSALVIKCLAKDKDERYQSVENLWTDLLDVQQGATPRGLGSRDRDATEFGAPSEIGALRQAPAPSFAYVLPARGLVVGRDAEIDAGFEEWTRDRSKPLLIWGPPGIGKSTLALSLLHHPEAERRFGGRRFLIRCDGFTHTESIQTAMGSEWFGLAASPRIGGEVLAQLATGPAAVVIDNFETPHRADPERSEDWLRRVIAIPDVWLMVGIQGHEAPRGLDWARRMEPHRLTPAQSRTLFCRIAGIEPDRAEPMDAVLRELDGVPHAIELLAHQAEADDDLSSLAERWSRQRTTLLQRGIGTTRQTNIAISYEFALASPAMSAGALQMLRILASLPSGLANGDVPIAMEEVSGVTAQDAASTLKRCALAFAEADRLRLLAPLREHVLKAHPASVTELKPLQDRFLRMAQSCWEIGKTDNGGNTLALVTREHLNCRWAVETALDASDPSAIESAYMLGNFNRFTGGGIDLLERAVTLARQLNDRSGEAHCIERIGDLARVRGDHDAARRYEEARSIYNQLGDRRSEAICIKRAGDVALDHCEHLLAQQRYEEALGIFREIGIRLGEATCVHGLANIALRRVDNASAQRQYQEAIAIYREVGAREGKASCFLGLADIAVFGAEYTEASDLYEEALAIYREIGARFGEAHSIRSLGNVALALSDHTSAERRFEQARAIYQDVLDPQGEALCIHSLGDLATLRGDHQLAKQRYASAVSIYRDVDDPHSAACCVLRLAENAVELGAFVEAARLFDEARVLFQQTEDRRGEVNVVFGKGQIALRCCEYDDATRLFEQARAMYRDIGERRGEPMSMLSLGDVALATSDRHSARAWYEQALAGFRSVRDRYSIADTLRRLARLEEHRPTRTTLIAEVVELWRETNRQDLINDLACEFPEVER